MELENKHCVPCGGGNPTLTHDEIEKLKKEAPDWIVVDDKRIVHEFKFKNFLQAMEFVNKIVPIAEAEGHHPDIYIFYNLVRLELSTHAANGLTENDFIMAAKLDGL